MLGVLPISLFLLSLSVVFGADDTLGSYAPQVNVACPTESLVRVFALNNQTLNPQEEEYVYSRSQEVLPKAWQDWLHNGSELGYTLDNFNSTFPKVGLAISGGGLRAAQYGAGVLSALDWRNESAKEAGTGGLLQVASYISGLSGGSWLTGSLYMNNWPTIPDLVYGDGADMSGWMLDYPLAYPGGYDLLNNDNQGFFSSILESVVEKSQKGFLTSLTDPWARMVSYHFLGQTSRSNFFTNNSAHGAGQLWSHIPRLEAWGKMAMPFPLICANSRENGSQATARLGLEEVVYELTPMEFGSWDPNLSAMADMTYAGTTLKNQRLDNATSCVTSFDQAGFIMGTSASLFNQMIDHASTNTFDEPGDWEHDVLKYILKRKQAAVRGEADDVSVWPNPFQGVNPSTFKDADSKWINLIDGASNAENIPLGALFVRTRGLDVVVAIDGSADTANHWPNGSSLVTSRRRMEDILQATHQNFPPTPHDTKAFLDAGVNRRATFFGCNWTPGDPVSPLLIYFPNSPPLNGDKSVTNSNTFRLSYAVNHTRMFLDQAHANTIGGFVPGSNEPDARFGKCLQCAAIDRARTKDGLDIPRSPLCEECFAQYCYDERNPPNEKDLPNRDLEFFDPYPQGLSKVEGFLKRAKGRLIGGFIALLVGIAALIGGLLWWKKRKERAAYKRVSVLHDDADSAPWRQYGAHGAEPSSAFSAWSAQSGAYEMITRK